MYVLYGPSTLSQSKRLTLHVLHHSSKSALPTCCSRLIPHPETASWMALTSLSMATGAGRSYAFLAASRADGEMSVRAFRMSVGLSWPCSMKNQIHKKRSKRSFISWQRWMFSMWVDSSVDKSAMKRKFFFSFLKNEHKVTIWMHFASRVPLSWLPVGPMPHIGWLVHQCPLTIDWPAIIKPCSSSRASLVFLEKCQACTASVPTVACQSQIVFAQQKALCGSGRCPGEQWRGSVDKAPTHSEARQCVPVDLRQMWGYRCCCSMIEAGIVERWWLRQHLLNCDGLAAAISPSTPSWLCFGHYAWTPPIACPPQALPLPAHPLCLHLPWTMQLLPLTWMLLAMWRDTAANLEPLRHLMVSLIM